MSCRGTAPGMFEGRVGNVSAETDRPMGLWQPFEDRTGTLGVGAPFGMLRLALD